MEQITLKIREAFILNLRSIMDERGLSYKDLGNLAGISKQRISDIFNRSDRGLNFATVEQIAKALDVEETDLTSEPRLLKIKKQLK